MISSEIIRVLYSSAQSKEPEFGAEIVAPRLFENNGEFNPSEVVNYMIILSPALADTFGVTENSHKVLALI
jgi:hypothetical protein